MANIWAFILDEISNQKVKWYIGFKVTAPYHMSRIQSEIHLNSTLSIYSTVLDTYDVQLT